MKKRVLDQVGLRLSRQALRVLKERGIFAHSPVSLQHQHLAKRYVVRGLARPPELEKSTAQVYQEHYTARNALDDISQRLQEHVFFNGGSLYF